MATDDNLLIGYISKPHGTSGHVVIYLNADIADDLNPGEPLFLEINETMVPFFIEEVEAFTERAHVKLEFIDSIDEVKRYIGCNVFVKSSKKEYSGIVSLTNASSMIGYKLFDENSGITGTITGIANTPANPLFEVRIGKNDFYIPIQPDLVVSIDHKIKCLRMNLPEGLIS